MKSKYMVIPVFIILLQFITSSKSKSIIKNLPCFDGDLPFTLQTGYIGMGEDDSIQVFYYFVESERNPSDDPLILYLTGGPGTSGLYPFLYEIGPLNFNFESSTTDNLTLALNPYSWSKVASVIYVDLPVGCGFSYAKTWEASKSSDSIFALQSYEFIRKWVVENPRFFNNPLYISGISYTGIIVPNAALEIYKGNERGNQPQLNIKGCLIVNPLTDKFLDFNSRFEFAHRLALISDEMYEYTKATCGGDYVYNDPENIVCAENLKRLDECTNQLTYGNILEPSCDAARMEPSCKAYTDTFIKIWVNNKDVQKALNIRKGMIGNWENTNYSIHYDFNKSDTFCYSYDVWSSIPTHKQLLTRNSQVLIMCGDHDMVFPYVGTEKWIRSLNLPIESPWEPWLVRTLIAGYQITYAQSGSSVKFATIMGGGHPLAAYKPVETLAMIDRWFASQASISDS